MSTQPSTHPGYLNIDNDNLVPQPPYEIELMSVPPGLNTRRLIKVFVEGYISALPKTIRRVRCSLCQGNRHSVKLWNVKPSNLIRHIMAHNGVKSFQCPFSEHACGAPQFTTKDQGIKHMEKFHSGTPAAAMIELDMDQVF